jgi:cellulose synthase/poly-beta-1,6-N-acetylglucosamine synthase-like glycosyltransferase
VTTLSIIIPTLNEERHVGALLSDLTAQTRVPDEVLVVDAGSEDGTREVVGQFAFAKLLEGKPPVACGRNLGGRSAKGDVLIFLDADARLPATFLEDFLTEFERRRLDVACPLYFPYRSTRAIEAFHIVFNLITRASQGVLPSGGGTCIAVRGGVFRGEHGLRPCAQVRRHRGDPAPLKGPPLRASWKSGSTSPTGATGRAASRARCCRSR